MNTESTRFKLLSRLAAAAGLLRGHGHPDSSAAVREASEALAALPESNDITTAANQVARDAESPLLVGNLNELRAIRKWHFDQYYDYAARAKEQQRKSDRRMFERDSRDAFERTADAYLKKANQHLRFVRSLNQFFPASDMVQ